MFEGWVADLLASYLGHFVDVQRKTLRLGLWSGLTLQDVRLRPEAFDGLQLPFKLKHGSIGRLQVRLPWGAFTLPNSYITIQLDDVAVETVLREPEDLCPGEGREQADVTQAELAASELDTLSGASADATAGGVWARGFAGLMEYVARFLLGRLKLSISNVTLGFEEGGAGTRVDVALGSLHTRDTAPGRRGTLLPSLGGNTLLAKELEIQGLRLGWRCAEDVPVSEVQVQVRDSTLCDMMRFADALDGWCRLSRYAAFRPAERPHAGGGQSWQPMWRYAFEAVRSDLPSRHLSGQARSVAHQALRCRYIELYKLHLAVAPRRGAEEEDEEGGEEEEGEGGGAAAELTRLEGSLTIAHVLLYRALAEQMLQKESNASATSTDSQQSGYIGSLLGWGLSRASSYVGYLPLLEGQTPLPEGAIAELSSILQEEELHLFEGASKQPPSGMQLEVHLDATRIHVALQAQMEEHVEEVASIEAQKLRVSASLAADSSVSLITTIQDVVVHDLCSDPGVSEILVARSGTPGFPFVLPPAGGGEASSSHSMQMPMIRITYGAPRGQPGSGVNGLPARREPSADQAECLEVAVQPTVLLARPVCLGRLMQVGDRLGRVPLYAGRLAQSAGQLGSRACRTTAKAEFLAKSSPAMGMNVRLSAMAVLLPSSVKATESGVMLQADGLLVKIASGMEASRAKELIRQASQPGAAFGVPTRPASTDRSVRAAVQELEDRLLTQRVSVATASVRAATVNFGVCAEEMLEPAEMDVSVSMAMLPAPATDMPLTRAHVKLGSLAVRVPLCELDILEGVAGAMQHLQELMPPAPEGDVSMLPREALAGLSSVRLTLPQLKVDFEDDVQKAQPNAALEVSDPRSRFQGLRREALPSVASDPAHTWLTVSLSGIAWSGYTDEECNFIQMCHKNPNLPAIEVTQESNAPAEGRGPSSTCTSVKLSDLCVGLDLIPAVLAAFGVGPGEQSAEQEGSEEGSPRTASEQDEEAGSNDGDGEEEGAREGEEGEEEGAENRVMVEICQCQVALSAWDSGRRSVAATHTPVQPRRVSRGVAGPDYLLLHIPAAHLSLPALGDKVAEEHELLSLDKAALYCCINGLQTSSPALLQLPQLAVTEMPRRAGAGHRLEARVAALEACLLLQVVEPVVKVVSSRLRQLESFSHGGSGTEQAGSERPPEPPPASPIEAQLMLGRAVVRIRDEDGETPALLAIHSIRGEVCRQAAPNGMQTSVSVSFQRLDVMSQPLAPEPADGSQAGSRPAASRGAWGSMPSLQAFGSNQSLGQASTLSSEDSAPAAMQLAPQPSPEVFDMEDSRQSPRLSEGPPSEGGLRGGSEDEEDFQDAPEDFASPSSSLRTFSGGSALLAWGRHSSLPAGSTSALVAEHHTRELELRPVLLSVGGPPEGEEVHSPGSSGVGVEATLTELREESTPSDAPAGGRPLLRLAVTLSALHASMAATGWEAASGALQRAADALARLMEPPAEAGPGKPSPSPASPSALEVDLGLGPLRGVLASRPCYAAEPCRWRGPDSSPAALPLLSVACRVRVAAALVLGSGVLPLPASATLSLQDIAVAPLALAPPAPPPLGGSFPASPVKGARGSDAREVAGGGGVGHLVEAGDLLRIAEIKVAGEVSTSVDLQLSVSDVACSASKHQLQLLNAWLADAERHTQCGCAQQPAARSPTPSGKPHHANAGLTTGDFLVELVEACGREPLGISVAAGVDRASLVFADSSPGGGAPPLLELCVRDVQCSGQGVLGSAADALDGALKATLCLEGWENVVEPWTVLGKVDVSQPWRQWSHAGAVQGISLDRAQMQSVSASIGSESVLQLTASAASSDVLSSILDACEEAFSAAPPGAPQTTLGRLLRDLGAESAQRGGYQLTNASGALLHYWPVHTPTGNALSSLWAAQSPGLSGLAEEPATGEGSSHRWALRSSAKKSLAPGGSCQLRPAPGLVQPPPASQPPLAGGRRASADAVEGAQRQRSGNLIKIQLEGQVKPCGPISLDTPGVHMMPTHLLLADERRVPVKVVVEVERTRQGGRNVTVHGCLELVNASATPLEVGLCCEDGAEVVAFGVVEPTRRLWLPVHIEFGTVRVRPKGQGQASAAAWQWSEGLPMAELLPTAAQAGQAGHRQLTCQAATLPSEPFCCWAGLEASQARAGQRLWALTIEPALLVHNSLPVPASIELLETADSGSQTEFRTVQALHAVEPLSQVALTTSSVHRAMLLRVCIPGHEVSPPVALQAVGQRSATEETVTSEGVAWRRDSCVVFLQPTGGGPGRPPAVSDGSQSTAGAALTVQQGRSLAAGGVLLRLSCSCWVYNCTGLPLGVRAYAAPLGEEGGHGEPLVRHQMGSWVSPFLPSNLGHARHARPDAPRAAHPWNTKSPKAGLRSTTDLADTDPAVVLLPRASARRQHRLGFSGTLGASDEGSAGTAAEVGVPWPGMLSSGTPEEGLGLGVPSPEGSVLVELSAGCSTDPEMWSIAAAVGHLGIPAIAEVALPEWYRAEGAHLPPGSLQVALSICPVVGAAGAAALHIYPRYILHNGLDKPLLWRQASAHPSRVCSLPPGASTALTWDDSGEPRRVMVRVHEPSWDWSRGFDVDSPGDTFIKLRQQVRGETLLVGVDVSASSTGCWVATLSNDAAGFAPYRLDNCTSYTLQCRQRSSTARADVLRPYCSLPFAWDEPNDKHDLVVELPDGRTLSTLNLDTVGHSSVHHVSHGQREPRDLLLITLSAEGPTCVLQVSDLKRHSPQDGRISARILEHAPLVATDDEPTARAVQPVAPAGSAAASRPGSTSYSAPFLSVSVELPGVGLSVVGASLELMYVYAEGVNLQASRGWVGHKVGLTVAGIQMDNQLSGATYPVVLCCPVRRLRMGGLRRLQPQADSSRPSLSLSSQAVSFQFAMWTRQPGGLPEAQQPKTAHLPDERLLALLSGDAQLRAPLHSRPSPTASCEQHYAGRCCLGCSPAGLVGIFGQPLRNLNYVGLGWRSSWRGPAMGLGAERAGAGGLGGAGGDGLDPAGAARRSGSDLCSRPRLEEPDAHGGRRRMAATAARSRSACCGSDWAAAGGRGCRSRCGGMDQRGLSGLLGGISPAGHRRGWATRRPGISCQISRAHPPPACSNLVAGSPAQLGRVRLPRHVPRGGVLRPYRRLEAVGHALLPAAVGSTTARHQAEEVLLCCVEVVGAQQAAGEASRGAGDEFAVLTPQRISQLHVPAGSAIAASAAVLVWAIQLQDILLVSKQGCQLELLSLTGPEQRRGHSDPTALVLGRQPALTSPQPAGSKHSPDAGRPHSPVRHTCIACRTEEAAAELEAQLDTLLRDARGDAGSPTVARDAPPLADRRSLSGLPSSSDISRTAELAGRAAREV
eukprot:jgi/Tetstr1/421967/TSEL_012866.t1